MTTSQHILLSTLLIPLTVITTMATTITISDDTHNALTKMGKKSETYDEIVTRLLKGYKKL